MIFVQITFGFAFHSLGSVILCQIIVCLCAPVIGCLFVTLVSCSFQDIVCVFLFSFFQFTLQVFFLLVFFIKFVLEEE